MPRGSALKWVICVGLLNELSERNDLFVTFDFVWHITLLTTVVQVAAIDNKRP